MRKKIIPLLILTAFQIGCAERYVYQDPAPVYRSRPPVATRKAPQTIETYKYPDEPVAQPDSQMQEEKIEDNTVSSPSSEPATSPESLVVPEPAENSTVQPPVVESALPAMPPVSMAAFSPAILSLATEADQNLRSGQYESAGVKLERALRIDPRNAVLTYKLASVRLKQEQPRLAEDLAKKAALLAGGDRDLKKRSWLLIAASKRMQNDADGAQKAEQKAMQF